MYVDITLGIKLIVKHRWHYSKMIWYLISFILFTTNTTSLSRASSKKICLFKLNTSEGTMNLETSRRNACLWILIDLLSNEITNFYNEIGSKNEISLC